MEPMSPARTGANRFRSPSHGKPRYLRARGYAETGKQPVRNGLQRWISRVRPLRDRRDMAVSSLGGRRKRPPVCPTELAARHD